MNEIEKQIETMQQGFISILNEIEMPLINKQYDIAHNIIRQAKKEIQEDMTNKKEVTVG